MNFNLYMHSLIISVIFICCIDAIANENRYCGIAEYKFVNSEEFNQDLDNVLNPIMNVDCSKTVSLAIFMSYNYNEQMRDKLFSLYDFAYKKCSTDIVRCLIRYMCVILYSKHSFILTTEAICRTNAEVNSNSYDDVLIFGRLETEIDSKTPNVKYLHRAIELNSSRYEVYLNKFII